VIPNHDVQSSETPRQVEISVVVPCYFTSHGLTPLHERLSATLQTLALPYEIIFIDDGSTDDTWQHIGALAGKCAGVVGLRLSRNFGQQAALLAGLEVSRGNRVLMIDDDLQDPPELLPQMLALMDQGADVVFGQRLRRDGESWIRKVLTRAFYRLVAFLSDTRLPVEAADFRLLSRRVVDSVTAMREQPLYLRGMISWVGFEQVALPYSRDQRTLGESHYHWHRLFRLAMEGLTSMSVRPLRLGILAGASTGIFALLLLVHILVGVLYGRPPQGWTSLMAVMLILGSTQLFVIGIIGEYLAAVFIRTQGRPSYLVRERIGGLMRPPSPE
jgi:polyisoprenyl-phosphate glycosyltransferase